MLWSMDDKEERRGYSIMDNCPGIAPELAWHYVYRIQLSRDRYPSPSLHNARLQELQQAQLATDTEKMVSIRHEADVRIALHCKQPIQQFSEKRSSQSTYRNPPVEI